MIVGKMPVAVPVYAIHFIHIYQILHHQQTAVEDDITSKVC